MSKPTLAKQKAYAFGKDCYLIGRDRVGDLIWLEAASWDCKWYWGFGYIEVYTNQAAPDTARDITSHFHWEGLLGVQKEGAYLRHINEALQETVLSDKESWALSDLMQSFYALQKAAAIFQHGGSHLSSTGVEEKLKNSGMANEINRGVLPELFKAVYAILEPTE